MPTAPDALPALIETAFQWTDVGDGFLTCYAWVADSVDLADHLVSWEALRAFNPRLAHVMRAMLVRNRSTPIGEEISGDDVRVTLAHWTSPFEKQVDPHDARAYAHLPPHDVVEHAPGEVYAISHAARFYQTTPRKTRANPAPPPIEYLMLAKHIGNIATKLDGEQLDRDYPGWRERLAVFDALGLQRTTTRYAYAFPDTLPVTHAVTLPSLDDPAV